MGGVNITGVIYIYSKRLHLEIDSYNVQIYRIVHNSYIVCNFQHNIIIIAYFTPLSAAYLSIKVLSTSAQSVRTTLLHSLAQ